jgi:hypothetical protein
MNAIRTLPAVERPRIAAVLAVAALFSVLLGFRLGMNRQDGVGFGLQVPAPGLDLSYTYAMNRASAEGRVFGREFVSTYGPFGYCIAGMDVPGIAGPWIFAQLFLTIALGLAAGAYALAVESNRMAGVVGALLLLLFVHALADEYRWLSLVLVVALLGLRTQGRCALAAFGVAGFLAGFCLLVKLSLGSGAVLIVIGAALLSRRPATIAARLAGGVASIASSLALGQWLHGGSLESTFDYFKTATAVTSGYSSAMSLSPPDWWKAAVAFGVFALCLAVALLAPGKPHLRAVAALLAFPTFVAWKHGLVRQDGHVEILTLFGLVLVVVTSIETAGAGALRSARPWLLVAAVGLLRVWYESPAQGPRPDLALAETLAQPLRLPGLTGLETLASLSEHRATLASESATTLESWRLPESARLLIGPSSVDFYPWEAAYAAANSFTWQSRPSPASFATYTPELDRLNQAFFASSSRPDFVLWLRAEGVGSIDRRHLFWDEPLTFRTLVDRYDSAWRGDVLLLKSRSSLRFGPPERLQTVDAGWNQWISLPRIDGALLAEIEIEKPLAARLRRFVLREEPAFVAVRFANGDRTRFRYVPDQAASGLFLQPLARNADDVAELFAGRCARTRVEAVSFKVFRPGARGPRITFWRLPGADGPLFDCDAYPPPQR